MTTVEEQISETIVGTLQERIAGWQSERVKLEGRMAALQKLQSRYDTLGELIAAAEKEIAGSIARAGEKSADASPLVEQSK